MEINEEWTDWEKTESWKTGITEYWAEETFAFLQW